MVGTRRKARALALQTLYEIDSAGHAVEEVLRGPSLPTAQITDAGMAHLKGLISLETLRLERTQVGDEGLAHLQGLTRLRSLDLWGCDKVTDVGFRALKDTLPELWVNR